MTHVEGNHAIPSEALLDERTFCKTMSLVQKPEDGGEHSGSQQEGWHAAFVAMDTGATGALSHEDFERFISRLKATREAEEAKEASRVLSRVRAGHLVSTTLDDLTLGPAGAWRLTSSASATPLTLDPQASAHASAPSLIPALSPSLVPSLKPSLTSSLNSSPMRQAGVTRGFGRRRRDRGSERAGAQAPARRIRARA